MKFWIVDSKLALMDEISFVRDVNIEICWFRGSTSDIVGPLPMESSGSVIAGTWSSGGGNVLKGGGRAATVSMLRNE